MMRRPPGATLPPNTTPSRSGGTIQVDKNATTASMLELQHTTIDGGHHGSFHIDSTLQTTAATDNIIQHFASAAFPNDGTVLVTGDGVRLLLLNDTLASPVNT